MALSGTKAGGNKAWGVETTGVPERLSGVADGRLCHGVDRFPGVCA